LSRKTSLERTKTACVQQLHLSHSALLCAPFSAVIRPVIGWRMIILTDWGWSCFGSNSNTINAIGAFAKPKAKFLEA